MKKLFAVLFAAMAFACSSDDDNGTVDNGLHDPYTGDVVSGWRVVAVSHNGDALPLGCDNPENTPQDVLFNLYGDNTFIIEHNCGDALPYSEGTYTKTGNVLTLIMGENNEVEEKAHMVVVSEDNPDTEMEEPLVLEWRFGIGNGDLLEGYDITVQSEPLLLID